MPWNEKKNSIEYFPIILPALLMAQIVSLPLHYTWQYTVK